MHIVPPRPPGPERAVLAGLLTSSMDPALFDIDMQEMRLLCATASAAVSDVVVQKRPAPEAATFLGPGKLREIAQLMSRRSASTLVVDADLSPAQVRSIEEIVGGKVVDRSQLILDIFAQHARTNEAQIQVELAQLRTLYPRLTRAWTHFSQQVGGIGTRGPGEKQLEIDRRLVQKKISDLKERLERIDQARETQRKSRKDLFKISLVGYTNVGKSSLLNALCGADVLVENRLFATLDTATRRAEIPGAGPAVISDTVGFIRKLPHHLVASFRSTLAVVREADLLLIVMDASCPWAALQLDTVNDVLRDLGAERVARLLVFNKADLVTDPFERKKLSLAFPDAVFVSAFDRASVQQLRATVGQTAAGGKQEENSRAS